MTFFCSIKRQQYEQQQSIKASIIQLAPQPAVFPFNILSCEDAEAKLGGELMIIINFKRLYSMRHKGDNE
jgi:hypothetical protein